jgi:uncharacterized protein (UPF0335 family)
MSVKGKHFNHIVPPKFRIQEGKATEQPALLDKIEDVKWERESYAQELKDAYNHRVEMGIIKTSAEKRREKQLLNKQLSDIQRELEKTINDVKSARGL